MRWLSVKQSPPRSPKLKEGLGLGGSVLLGTKVSLKALVCLIMPAVIEDPLQLI